MPSIALSFVGGIPFTLLYDGVKMAMRKTTKFKANLAKLQFTLDCLEPQIIQQIEDNNVQLHLPNVVIQEIKAKMEEGIKLVEMVLKLSMWNIRIWGNCYNCIGPDWGKDLDELERSLRILMGRLDWEGRKNITDLIILETGNSDKLDKLNKEVELLSITQQKMLDMMMVQSSVKGGVVQNTSVQKVASSSGGAIPAPALGAVFQQLFDITMQVNVKNIMFKRLLERFKSTLRCLQPLIEEIAKHNRILHLPDKEVKDLTKQFKNGEKLFCKCSKVCKRANYKKNEYTTEILSLNNVLQRLFNRLKVQVEKNVKETFDSANKIEAMIKNIENGGVVEIDDLRDKGHSPVEPGSPAVVRHIQEINKQGSRDVTKVTLVNSARIVIDQKGLESNEESDVVKEQMETAYGLDEPLQMEEGQLLQGSIDVDSTSSTNETAKKEEATVLEHLKSRENVRIQFKKLFRRNNSCGERKRGQKIARERKKGNAMLWIIPSNCNAGSKVSTFCFCIKPFKKYNETEMIMQLSQNREMIMQAPFPEECIGKIISLTTPADACRLSSVSRRFNEVAESDEVWEKFLPSPHLICTIQSQSTSISTVVPAKSKKQIYFALCDNPVLIDNGKMSFSLDKWSGKKCYMICAKELYIVWAEDKSSYWTWKSLPESRFEKVAHLNDVCWLEIRGKIDMSILSPWTLYKAYLVYKLTEDAHGFDEPVEVILAARHFGFEYGDLSTTLDNENKQIVYLDPSMEIIDGARRPKARADGWLEVDLGEFLCQAKEDGELEMVCAEYKNLWWKSGLIVQGIEVRPGRQEYFKAKGKASSSY